MRAELETLKSDIRKRLFASMDMTRDISDEEILEMIDREVITSSCEMVMTFAEKKMLRSELFHAMRKLDVLQDLVDDPTVTEIMINGKDDIFIEKSGRLSKYDLTFESKEKLEDVIQKIVAGCNRVVNEASPIVDARLENGSRVNIVLPPIALNGPIVTIRRFPDEPINMKKLMGFGSVPEYIVKDLQSLVRAGYNIFISGGTGSGKTTFLNALSDSIPSCDRVITIEDNAELQILHVPNIVKMESRNANVEGCKEISIRDLIKSSLRMRPDRIIVGEVRGGEALDMVQAMNTGHDGSMSTGHANSAKDMLSRLETMILMAMDLPLPAIRRQLSSGIDLIVHLGRLRDRSRKLLEICEVPGGLNEETGEVRLNVLWQYVETGEDDKGKVLGEWRKTGELENREKLAAAGLVLPSEAQRAVS
ncbi:MAG: CpaF family protein [Butyrivibrio sp.]|uniref:CpaF family protein n=1 Tax=Butyrivibrio sp. TaxID=28121 RepID=UPI0025E642AA|nr:CpaF family protein [Butyrivibrio sp.]MCR5771780.1 CpaF family protein [Butyrivibrio sp.]